MTTIRLEDTPLASMTVEIYQANIQQWVSETKDITRRLAKLTATIRTLTQANADEYVEGEKPSLEKLQQLANSLCPKSDSPPALCWAKLRLQHRWLYGGKRMLAPLRHRKTIFACAFSYLPEINTL